MRLYVRLHVLPRLVIRRLPRQEKSKAQGRDQARGQDQRRAPVAPKEAPSAAPTPAPTRAKGPAKTLRDRRDSGSLFHSLCAWAADVRLAQSVVWCVARSALPVGHMGAAQVAESWW